MSHRTALNSLLAFLLASAALVGCGGGDAEPPPPPVGPPAAGPDTAAPTLTISNNVSTATASGPVTFTFVFSEDVGTSFDGTDITVDGGTASAFTRVDGRQATLVVTPPTGTGAISVSVAAGSVTDLAGNANAAGAQAAKNYAVSGGGGGTAPDLVFSTGLASATRTIEGGEVGGFSGSNVDGFNCSPPAACGGGGEFPTAVPAADSYFFYFYQTPTPATDLYMGVYMLAPGVVGPLSDAVDHAGVQINGQTAIKFKVGQNAEWFGTATNRYAVNLQLGKRYVAGGGACRIQLRTIVTPTAQPATEYTVPLSAFSVVQDCGQGFTVAQALADSPITQVTFQAGAGGPAQSAGGQTTGANLTVQGAGSVYPTTLVVVGGITFQP